MRIGYKLAISLCLACMTIFVNAEHISTFEKDVTLSLKQKQLLDKFKALVQDRLPHDYMKDDIYLIKFLRSRNFDILKAEKFLMQIVEWRRENKMDLADTDNWSDMMQNFKYNLDGRDKYGQPVLYINVGGMDLRKVVIQGDESRFLRYVDRLLDEACTLVRTLGDKYHNVTRGHLMINAKGYNLVEHGCLRCIPSLLRIVVSYEQHWPECVDKILILNAPGVIVPLIEAARPLLSPLTRNSLVIMGSNKNQNLEFLKEYFEIEEIPVQLGGRKVLKNLGEDDYDNYHTFQ